VKVCRFPVFLLFLAAAALVAGPSLRLQAASPCAVGPPMACCGGAQTGDENAALPCGCTLKPVTPSPAVVDAAAPPVVLAEAPVTEAPAPDVTSALSGAAVPRRARAGPLFLLFSALLN
jgi:hypothetical protein